MLLNISDILQEVGLSFEFNSEVAIDDIAFQGDNIEFHGPVNIQGNVINGGDLIHLYGHLCGEATMECDICRENFQYPIDFDIDISLKSLMDEEEPELYFYSNSEIDLEDILVREFLLRLPIQRRCSEKCKGLCPDCGINLNLEKCSCKSEDNGNIDLRLADLKDLLADMDREV